MHFSVLFIAILHEVEPRIFSVGVVTSGLLAEEYCFESGTVKRFF